MIFPDVNLLLYAQIGGFPEHAKACRWWEQLMNGDTEVAIAAPALFGFVRLVTNPRVFDHPLLVEDALDRVTEWLDRPHVHLATPGPRHLEIAFRLLRDLAPRGRPAKLDDQLGRKVLRAGSLAGVGNRQRVRVRQVARGGRTRPSVVDRRLRASAVGRWSVALAGGSVSHATSLDSRTPRAAAVATRESPIDSRAQTSMRSCTSTGIDLAMAQGARSMEA
jgi:toxin-antitoxin system PIN domain toxin